MEKRIKEINELLNEKNELIATELDEIREITIPQAFLVRQKVHIF